MEDIRREALRWALTNALEHDGRASAKAVLGKLVAELPGWRSKIKELSAMVEQVVAEVNELPHEEKLLQLRKVGPVERLKPEERRGLPELPDVEKYPMVITRFAPNPNGPLHLGHIRAALLSHEYARRYKGKFILRFEDTNPENALLEMYELIRRDLRWLDMSWDEEHAQSDRLELYYNYAEQLLSEGKAYVCTCPIEDFRELRDRGEPCPCRELSSGEQLQRWRRMLAGGIAKGEAVVRIKTNLNHPNPAVRDWPALRVTAKPHPRMEERYSVWPLYNFSVSIDDHEMGVTHIIRGKEHEVNEQRQRTLFEHLGWKYPTAVQYGRLNMAGMALSKTQTMQGIRDGELTGYDDVRLGTIAALRRRGFVPEAIKQLILDIGPTLVDSSLSWETLYAYNRKFSDERADRYFFVQNPVKVLVHKTPDLKQVRLRLHPGHPEHGERILPLAREGDALVFYLAGEDTTVLQEGQIFRLKDLMNVTLSSKGKVLEAEFQGLELADVPKIQWVSAGAVEVEVIKPDNSREFGLAEPAVAGLKVDTILQFERYGFVRVDAVRPKLVAAYAHR
ncbi:MAG: glutamate--tRNA ligase [Candidatus Hadarchaeaceae archaeon]